MLSTHSAITVIFIFNIILVLVIYVLFYQNQSTAEGIGGYKNVKWKADGALAGFIILFLIEIPILLRLLPDNPIERESYQVVSKYHQAINNKKLDEAWELLSEELQKEKWNYDKDLYKSGYKNTVRLSNLSICFDRAASEFSEDYIVYYVDEVKAPVLSSLENIREICLSDLPQLKKNINDLTDYMNKNNINGKVLDEIKIKKLFSLNYGNKLIYEVKEKTKRDITVLFDKHEYISYIMGFRVVTVNEDGSWKIRAFEVINKK